MGSFTLIWLTAVAFAGVAFWGVNVPANKRSMLVIWLVVSLVIFNLVAQSYLFRGHEAALAPGAAANAEKLVEVQKFLDAMALIPGSLRAAPVSEWYRVITSSYLHGGWLHLLVNAWFFVLFGHALEQVLGKRKFLVIVVAGLIIPPALDGIFGSGPSPSGGFGGVVYAVMGAYIVCFPRSRCYGALNYDLRFWAAALFIMLPTTIVTSYAGMTLTEPVLMAGLLGFFLLIQPEHARFSVAVGTAMLYKLLLDVLLIQPVVGDIAGNTHWRVFGGFFIGCGAGFMLNGMRGWTLTWEDETKPLPSASRSHRKMSLSQLEAAGQKNEDAARAFLGQRVFVGDSARATAFYRDVVMQAFPDLMLPLQEQIALARLLHFKGYDKESLHAYETLLRATPALPEEYWIAWLKAAELIVKVDPPRAADARNYLDRFEEGTDLAMRDRIEAEQLRANLHASDVVPVQNPALNEHALVKQANKTTETAPQSSYGAAEDSELATPEHATHGLRMSRTRKKQQIPTLDFPKITPRTFVYQEGEGLTPVKFPTTHSGAESADRRQTIETQQTIETHWKPLPCVTGQKLSSPAILERRVKNPQMTEDVEKTGMYGDAFRGGRKDSPRKRGRLARLEVARSELKHQVPESESKSSRYGGLEEHKKAGSPPHTGFRLRGEKDPAASPRQRIQRRSPATDINSGPPPENN